jgi:hypothetical protein
MMSLLKTVETGVISQREPAVYPCGTAESIAAAKEKARARPWQVANGGQFLGVPPRVRRQTNTLEK